LAIKISSNYKNGRGILQNCHGVKKIEDLFQLTIKFFTKFDGQTPKKGLWPTERV